MAKGRTSSRHLAWEVFESRIDKGVPSAEPIEGSPPIQLIVEEHGRRIAARLFSAERISEPSPLAEVAIRQIGVGAKTAIEISTGNHSLFPDFYALCCQIADRVQIDGQPVAKAVTSTLESWSALLKRKKILSEPEQIGLIGELLFLQHVAKALGWQRAAGTWYGPGREEHDFVLPAADAEVKTTVREERLHRISSATQLVPKVGRPLFLISIQLTAGGEARASISLPDLAAEVLTKAAQSSQKCAELIRDRLWDFGWYEVDNAYYVTRYSLRSSMQAIAVDKSFPAVSPQTVARSSKEAWRIQDVQYSVNVEGLGFSEQSAKFKRIFRIGAQR